MASEPLEPVPLTAVVAAVPDTATARHLVRPTAGAPSVHAVDPN